MATVLDCSELQIGYRKYDWDSWLDGRQWSLEQGVDFMPQIEGFRPYVYTAAKLRGLKVSTKVTNRDGKKFLVVRAHVVPSQIQHP